MLTIQLIRHASCDHVGRRLAGRTPGVHLNTVGEREAYALARALSGRTSAGPTPGRPGAIYSGPLERATETAAVLAESLGLTSRVARGLDELDFGDWTGLSLEELDADPTWRAFNAARATTRIPGGELMAEVIDRALGELRRMERSHPDGTVAAVSHGDVIRGLLLHTLGMPLDDIHRIEVSPASVSVIELWDAEPRRVTALNWTAPWGGGR